MKKLSVFLMVVVCMAFVSCSDDFQDFENEQKIENSSKDNSGTDDDPDTKGNGN
ncbi:MAG: hypothetical protein HRT61_12870 [Ekhidna sp.]|nr:hypothetical protein [Ekhidna sp.]